MLTGSGLLRAAGGDNAQGADDQGGQSHESCPQDLPVDRQNKAGQGCDGRHTHQHELKKGELDGFGTQSVPTSLAHRTIMQGRAQSNEFSESRSCRCARGTHDHAADSVLPRCRGPSATAAVRGRSKAMRPARICLVERAYRRPVMPYTACPRCIGQSYVVGGSFAWRAKHPLDDGPRPACSAMRSYASIGTFWETRFVASGDGFRMNMMHDWAAVVDCAHLSSIRAVPGRHAPDGLVHLALEVIAYRDDEAQAQGRAGFCVVTMHADGSVSVADDRRGTDIRRNDLLRHDALVSSN